MLAYPMETDTPSPPSSPMPIEYGTAVLASLGLDLGGLKASRHGRAIVELLCTLRTDRDLIMGPDGAVPDFFDPPARVPYELAHDKWRHHGRMQIPSLAQSGVLGVHVFEAWRTYTDTLRATLSLPPDVRLTAALVVPSIMGVVMPGYLRNAFWENITDHDKAGLAIGYINPSTARAVEVLVPYCTPTGDVVRPHVPCQTRASPDEATIKDVNVLLWDITKHVRTPADGRASLTLSSRVPLSEALAKGMPPRRLALPIVSLGRADREADPGNYFLCKDDVGSLMMAAARGCPAYALSALGYMRKDDPAPLDVNGEWLIERLCSTHAKLAVLLGIQPFLPTTEDGEARFRCIELVILYLVAMAELGPNPEAVRGALCDAFQYSAESMATYPEYFLHKPATTEEIDDDPDLQMYTQRPTRIEPDGDVSMHLRSTCSRRWRAAVRVYTGHVGLCNATLASRRLGAWRIIPVTHWFSAGTRFCALAQPSKAVMLVSDDGIPRPWALKKAAAVFQDIPRNLHSLIMPLGDCCPFDVGAVFEGCTADALAFNPQTEELWIPAWAFAARAREDAALEYNAMDSIHGILGLLTDLVGYTISALAQEFWALYHAMKPHELSALTSDASLEDLFARLNLEGKEPTRTKPKYSLPPVGAPHDPEGRAHWLLRHMKKIDTLTTVRRTLYDLLAARVTVSSTRPRHIVVDEHVRVLADAAADTCVRLGRVVDGGQLEGPLPFLQAYEAAASLWKTDFAKPRKVVMLDEPHAAAEKFSYGLRRC